MPSSAPRTCCLDLDTFFVSVERLLDPSLVGRPVVVGAEKGHRGVVTAASYEVRAFGVRSGMSMRDAVRLAPDAIFLPTRHSTYTPYAKEVRAVAERFCPDVRPASIDEFYLDFAGCERLYHRPGDPHADATIERVVRELREAIQDEVGLPASVGIGTTRAIAKIASGQAKPAGVRMVRHGEEWDFLAGLPVRTYPGIGPVAERQLLAAGVHSLGDLLRTRGPIRQRFRRLADRVHRDAIGQPQVRSRRDRPAFMEYDPDGLTAGSISNERTFREDVGDPRAVLAQLRALTERVCWRARKRDIRARTVTVKLRFADFDTVTRSCSGPHTHHEPEVFRRVRALYRAARTRTMRVRLVGVCLSNLVGPSDQLPLPLSEVRTPVPGPALDAVRERFGYDAIRMGATGTSGRWLG